MADLLGWLWFPLSTTFCAVFAIIGTMMQDRVTDPVASAIWRILVLAATIALGIAWGLTIVGQRFI